MGESICPREMRTPNQKLKQERERRGWTLEDVARYVNRLPNFDPQEMNSATIAYWEQGLAFPSPRYCHALCMVFQMDTQALGLLPPPFDTGGTKGQEDPENYQTVAYTEPENHHSKDQKSNNRCSVYLTRSEAYLPSQYGEDSQYNARSALFAQKQHFQPEGNAETLAYTAANIDNTVSKNIKNAQSPQEKNNRQHLLKRVRRFWITDVLEHSLHHAALIELGFQTRPDALVNPWHLLQESAQTKRTLPPRTSMLQVYDEADGALLVLGEPGAGKTTLLLELARNLLDRAENDENHLIPVIFNLSSWAIKRAPLQEWLIEEMHDKYQVPRKVGEGWVVNERILLLLDGLDEVTSNQRTACIEAINSFRRAHGLVPIVVCSRSAEYHTLSIQLGLQIAIVIQALTPQQIELYLKKVGKPLEALRIALQHDFYLQELATTPLMLSVLTLAYHGMPLDEILNNSSLDTKRQQIFSTYTQRMLTRRGTSSSHPPAQTIQWLSYLARQMKRQNQSVFYIEHIQRDWLEDTQAQRTYERLAIQLIGICVGALISLVISLMFIGSMTITVRTIYGLMGALLGGLLSGKSIEPLPMTSSQPQKKSLNNWLSRLIHNGPIRNGLCVALLIILVPGGYLWHMPLKGLFIGSTFGFTSWLLSALFVPGSPAPRKQRLSTLLKQGLLIGGIIGLCTSLSFGFLIGPVVGIGFGLIVGISFGLIAILLLLFFSQRSQTIQLTEIISWSPHGLLKGLVGTRYLKQGVLVGSLVSLGVGISNALIIGPSVTLTKILSIEFSKILALGEDTELIYRAILGLGFGLSTGLSFGLSYCFILGLLTGLSNQKLEEHRRLIPNQGVGRSALNGLIVGTICGWASWGIHVLMLFFFTKSCYLLSIGLSDLIGKGSSQQLDGLLEQGLNTVLSIGLQNSLYLGPTCGLLVGLIIGGWACIQHTVLRFLLWRSEAIPWNYSQFLDFATERILLRKVGGGYIFVHRLLLDYFAALLPRQDADQQQISTKRAKYRL